MAKWIDIQWIDVEYLPNYISRVSGTIIIANNETIWYPNKAGEPKKGMLPEHIMLRQSRELAHWSILYWHRSKTRVHPIANDV